MANNKTLIQSQNPLIVRCHRLIEAFAKSDDERDFYIDRQEGFIIHVDLDKPGTDIDSLQAELTKNSDRYCLIPKLTFYETKKIMEGFVNEKVYDIDTKEKMMEVIGSKEAMANFLDFLYDHHAEYEKWQLYYQERSRVRIIEWLRQNHFTFVFEEDLDLPRDMIEKLKKHLFDTKVDKEILNLRKELVNKSKTYYSNEALNPRPKRGRPPKQTTKAEIEPQITSDMYTTVPTAVLPFLFTPALGSSPANAFSTRFEHPDHAHKPFGSDFNVASEDLKEKLSLLRRLSSKWVETEKAETKRKGKAAPIDEDFDVKEDDWSDDEEIDDADDIDREEIDEDIVIKTKRPSTPPMPKAKKALPPPPKKKVVPPPPPPKKNAPPPPPPKKNAPPPPSLPKKNMPPPPPKKKTPPPPPPPKKKASLPPPPPKKKAPPPPPPPKKKAPPPPPPKKKASPPPPPPKKKAPPPPRPKNKAPPPPPPKKKVPPPPPPKKKAPPIPFKAKRR